MSRTKTDRPILRWSYVSMGLGFAAAAGVAAALASRHMAALGAICGESAPHCGWCYAAVGLTLLSASAIFAASRTTPAQVRVGG
jgi:hypothetical protein